MHPTTSHFVAAVADPFQPGARGAKLPAGSPAATLAQGAKLSFDGIIGSDGTACLFFNPSPWSDLASIWYSNNSGSLGFVTFDNTVAVYSPYSTGPSSALLKQGLNAVGFSGLPYNADAVNGITTSIYGLGQQSGFTPPTVRARVVSMGVDISFSGTTLNDGGVFYSLVDPVHDNMVGQSQQSYVANFTSMKWQRLAKRKNIRMTILPVTRDQQELSYTYDDCAMSLSPAYFPLQGPAGQAFPNPGAGTGLIYTGGILLPISSSSPTLGPITGLRDPIVEMRNQVCLLWPLSRKNACVICQPEIDVNNAAIVRTCTSSGSGLVTWTVNPPANPNFRQVIQAYGVSNNLIPTVYFYWTGSAWFSLNELGGVMSIGGATSFRFNSYVAVPPVVAGIFINAGTAMAGQTFHVEAVIHCEYSGLGVQGRTTVTVPDQQTVDVMQAANLHARESTSNEVIHGVQHVASAAVQLASAHMPEVAAGIASSLGVPELAGPLAYGAGVLSRSLKRGRFF